MHKSFAILILLSSQLHVYFLMSSPTSWLSTCSPLLPFSSSATSSSSSTSRVVRALLPLVVEALDFCFLFKLEELRWWSVVSYWTEAAELGSGVAGLDEQHCRRRCKVASSSTSEPARGWGHRAGGDGGGDKGVEIVRRRHTIVLP